MISLVIHGGAWDIPRDLLAAHKSGVEEALQVGWKILRSGGSAVDAVEAAIKSMEDDETFDAGRGSFLNTAGDVELDASFMDGRTFRAGAVAAVQNVKNPISLARRIMEESEHILLVGIGATRFAREHKVPTCNQDYLVTDRALQRWRYDQNRKKGSTKQTFKRMSLPVDTVGAVAMDEGGNIASGTSTGGTPNKHVGRVGDSPLIGCGTYADNSVGGASTTGWGEGMIKVVMAKTVLDLIERDGLSPEDAARQGIAILERKADGFGGVILMNRTGEIGMAYNTPHMARGYMDVNTDQPVVLI